jgi:Cof subfamily protein (haloacid dehalogenase superfamily)
MTIKLIVCDLDGTLIGDDFALSPRVRQAVARARAEGITVTLASGRGYPSMRGFAQQLGVEAPLIAYQGAQTWTADGALLDETLLSRAYLPQAIEYCRTRGLELSVYCQDQVYQTTRRYDDAYYAVWFGLTQVYVDDLMAALPGDPIKYIAIAPDAASADRIEREVTALAAGRYQVMRSHQWFVEGLAAGVSKGAAAEGLAARLGVAREEVMALGDGGNDLALVEWAGLGVAMGNAAPAVRAAADVIAPPQAEDGAAWVIEQYALNGGRA